MLRLNDRKNADTPQRVLWYYEAIVLSDPRGREVGLAARQADEVGDMSSSVLEGSLRLLFEPLQARHAAELFDPLSDPRVWEHITDNPVTTVAALAERFDQMASGPPDRADEQWINYAVRLRTNNALIGTIQATIIDRRAEVAFLFGLQYWGQGYATEAMSALHSNLRQSGSVDDFWATTDPRNMRSIQLLNRLGYAKMSASWPNLSSYEPGDLVFVLR